jgi:hypothetical protein
MTKERIDKFSLFGKGYKNRQGVAVLQTRPQSEVEIRWVFDYITSDRARWATDTLRALPDEATKEERSDFKKLNFECATFNGIFSYRNARSLVTPSPFMVIDIDDLNSTEEAREVQQALISNDKVETALCFVSPKGRGVKWVVRLPEWAQHDDFKQSFLTMQQHVAFHYGIAIDKSGSDVCRACFLPHDPECYINPIYFIR